jgi:bile salt-stimulated lipase
MNVFFVVSVFFVPEIFVQFHKRSTVVLQLPSKAFTMKFKIFLCVFIVQVIIFATSQDVNVANFRTVFTFSGQVQGIVKQTITGREYVSFQSIPYMKPPVGKLRFRDPEAPSYSYTTIDATKEPSQFPQNSGGQEDAGVINVYTPNTNAFPRLPVVVFIHGGGFNVS